MVQDLESVFSMKKDYEKAKDKTELREVKCSISQDQLYSSLMTICKSLFEYAVSH